MASSKGPPNPIAEQWREVHELMQDDEHRGPGEALPGQRWEEQGWDDLPPLEALLESTAVYQIAPPLALLRVLHRQFERYMRAEGKLSLEEVFFGPPTKKAGNYAARSAGLSRFAYIAAEVQILRRTMPPAEAYEQAAMRFSKSSKTIERIWREHVDRLPALPDRDSASN